LSEKDVYLLEAPRLDNWSLKWWKDFGWACDHIFLRFYNYILTYIVTWVRRNSREIGVLFEFIRKIGVLFEFIRKIGVLFEFIW